MNPPDSKAELLELCDRLLDGDFTAEHRARLETLVLGNADLRRLYVEVLHEHAALRQNASRLGPASLAEVLHAMPEELPANVVRARFPRWPLQLAAAVAVCFAVWWFAPRPGEKSLARLVETNGARWENSSLPTTPGSALRAGRLRLADGVARIVFQSGAEVSLEGPAELELTGGNACYLHAGALTAHVPEQARGFSVGTANAKLIDHGTDFGISTDAAGRAQVQVLKGEVELQHDRSGEKLRLLTKESATITAERFKNSDKAESEPDRYAFARTVHAERPPTLILTTAGGSGDAAYVVSPGSKIHFSDTLLLVKNAPGEPYRRKAFLRFDLAPLHDRRVAEASLTLNFESTGFGYASLTGEHVFAVYGLTDDVQDAWSADTLTWESAPAFAPGAGEVDPTRAVKLGTFTTARGVVSGTYSIEGPALAEFLNADVNRHATLIVVRETMEEKNTGAVHGFAGNRHPTLAPPTLRLTLAP
jgi:ferric-dicitrate binding protein FerR (iron transport regulator)